MVKRAPAAVAIACVCSAAIEARVTRFEIAKVERVAPPASGAAVGDAATEPYERLSGTFQGELDPADPKRSSPISGWPRATPAAWSSTSARFR